MKREKVVGRDDPDGMLPNRRRGEGETEALLGGDARPGLEDGYDSEETPVRRCSARTALLVLVGVVIGYNTTSILLGLCCCARPARL